MRWQTRYVGGLVGFFVLLCCTIGSGEGESGIRIPVKLNELPTRQFTVDATVGGQRLRLALDTKFEGLRLFATGTQACRLLSDVPDGRGDHDDRRVAASVCYNPLQSKTIRYCVNNLRCEATPGELSTEPIGYACANTTTRLEAAVFHEYHDDPTDSLDLVERRAEATETISLDWMQKAPHSPYNHVLLIFGFPVKLAQSHDYPTEWPVFQGSDGILGITGPSCRRSSLLPILLNVSGTSAVAFDIFVSKSKSTLRSISEKDRVEPSEIESIMRRVLREESYYYHASSEDNEVSESTMTLMDNVSLASFIEEKSSLLSRPMLWSEAKEGGEQGVDSWFLFQLYRPELCGANLLYNQSSHWSAVIDIGSTCLSLPPDLWESVMSWLPVNCTKEKEEEKEKRVDARNRPRFCRVLPPSIGAQRRPLPNLKFGLRDPITLDDRKTRRQDVQSDRFAEADAVLDFNTDTAPSWRSFPNNSLDIPLESLVFWDTYTKQELLCVVVDTSVAYGQVVQNTMNPPISFGTMVLQNFVVVANQRNASVGLISKTVSPPSDESCVPRSQCRGLQVFYPPLNMCEDPDCSRWFFKVLDQETRTCQYASYVPQFAFGMVAGLAIIDLYIARLQDKALRRARSCCR